MADTFRALCAELVGKIEYTWGNSIPADVWELLNCARNELALSGEPAVPAPPADGEVAELVAWLRETGRLLNRRPDIQCRIELRLFARAAELLQRQVLVPVAVSERLPGPEDCNAEGKCWLRGKVEGDWRLINPEKSGVPHLKYCFTHWLPAHALPLPEVNNG